MASASHVYVLLLLPRTLFPGVPVSTTPQVTISCLINQISDLPPEQRRIPLSTIAGALTKILLGGGMGEA
jgi:hypothetical protein